MTNAEEMLAQALAGDNEPSSEDNQILVVNWDRRTIDIPSNMKCLGVESDDDVTQVEFLMPKTYCDVDLSEFLIYINYLNAKGEGDVYKVKDATVVDDAIAFTWLVGRNALTYKGVVKFNVCLKKMDAEDPTIVDRELNTTITSLPVLEGLETSEAVIQKYADILVEWEQELFGKFDTLASNLDEKIVGKVGEYIKENPEDVDNAVTKYLSENPPPPGPIGPVGPQGETGESAYDAAVRLGLTTLSEDEWVREYDVKRTQAIQDIETKHTEAVNDINTKYTEAVNDINEAGEGHVEAINAAVENAVIRTEELEAASATQVTKVNNAGTAQVTAVNAAGATQIAAIENKGKNTLADIPETYTDLDSKVKYLNDFKADAIVDTSAKAASHELYAQDGPMSVALHGATYQAGTGDPSPDNVRPISGVDVARVHCGSKNLWQHGNQTFTQEKIITFTPSLPAGQCTFSALVTSAGTRSCNIVFYEEGSNNNIGSFYLTPNTGERTARIVNSSKPIQKVYLRSADTYGNSSGIEATYADIQIEIGDTATAYEPYNANVIDMTAALNSEPLYGDGTVMDTVENDVQSGCDEKVVLDGSHTINPATANGYVNVIVSLKKPALTGNAAILSDAKSDYLPCKTYGDITTGGKIGFALHSTNALIIVLRIPGLEATAEAYNAYLTEHPLTVYYRSTEYTPDKDLRVCRVTRQWKKSSITNIITINGTEYENVWYYTFTKPSDAHDYNKWSGVGIVGEAFSPEITGSYNSIDRVGTITGNIAKLYYCIGFPSNTTREEATSALVGRSYIYRLATPEVYYTDPYVLRKPYSLMPVTVTGSGETAVEYLHDTKHYINHTLTQLITVALAKNQ